MHDKNLKTVFISFRVAQQEFDQWEKARRDKGFKSRSTFIREGVNATLSNITLVPAPLSREGIVHLKRASAILNELTVLVAVNDNALAHPETKERLHEALDHILSLKRCG